MGFAKNSVLVVTEAAPMDPLGGSASSYRIAFGRSPIVSVAVMNFQEASCWMTIHPDGTRAYVSNTGSDTVSTYGVDEDGELTIRQQGVKIPSSFEQVAPIDADISDDGSAFYQLLGATGEIAIFKVDASGDLHFGRSISSGLARGSQGLAVWR
jgi:6-phosphogluconolactonase (cycloisomerase 2 family)